MFKMSFAYSSESNTSPSVGDLAHAIRLSSIAMQFDGNVKLLLVFLGLLIKSF